MVNRFMTQGSGHQTKPCPSFLGEVHGLEELEGVSCPWASSLSGDTRTFRSELEAPDIDTRIPWPAQTLLFIFSHTPAISQLKHAEQSHEECGLATASTAHHAHLQRDKEKKEFQQNLLGKMNYWRIILRQSKGFSCIKRKSSPAQCSTCKDGDGCADSAQQKVPKAQAGNFWPTAVQHIQNWLSRGMSTQIWHMPHCKCLSQKWHMPHRQRLSFIYTLGSWCVPIEGAAGIAFACIHTRHHLTLQQHKSPTYEVRTA